MNKIFTVLAFILVSVGASAQVTLDECMKWSRQNYPEVKKYDIISITEACNISNASKNWLPLVSLNARGGWTNSTADFSDMLNNLDSDDALLGERADYVIGKLNLKPISNWQYRAGVEVTQPIYDGGAIALQRKVAHGDAEVERAKIEVSLHSLDDKVIDVYFAILLLEERKEQAEMNEQLLERNLAKLRNLQEQDIINQNDVEELEVEKLNLRQSLDVIDENIQTYRTTLCLLTGKSLIDKKLLRPELPTSALIAFSETPEMKLLDRQSELLYLKERYEIVKTLPKIGLIGQAYYGAPGNNLFRNLVDRSPQLNMGIALNVVWDISPFYTKKNNLRLIQMQQATIDNTRELLRYRQRITNTSYDAKLKRLKNIRQQDDKIVELRQKLREAEEVKVDNDMVDATQLLSKITDESTAKLQRSIHETEMLLDLYKLNINGDTEK